MDFENEDKLQLAWDIYEGLADSCEGILQPQNRVY